MDDDISIVDCALTADRDLQKKCCSGNIFDCAGYYFQRQLMKAAGSPTIKRYTAQKEYFECHGELHTNFSKANESATIIYEHVGHTESQMFHMTQDMQDYIRAHKRLSPRQIYQNLIQMTNKDFEHSEVQIITHKAGGEWQRDAADDFRSAQLLVAEQDGYELIQGLQEPGISLAIVTSCFRDRQKFDLRQHQNDGTHSTNKHGFDLYCVLPEYNLVSLVSLPLSYILLARCPSRWQEGIAVNGVVHGIANAGLKPNVVHTDKDFAEVTVASLAFGRSSSAHNHHLCLWHSLRAIDHISQTEGILSKGETKQCTAGQARDLRTMTKRHLLRQFLLAKVVVDKANAPENILCQNYEDIHASSIKEMLEYCSSIDQPKLF
ncbi:hypothetical protein V1508DRAFT_455731 [Lipomyces doorenjongii]|uniref:uncharacterized protein n=1 Tax=Lipomyces doorenjongii TaxID=383834 RepID=UPI0034CE2059